MIRRSPLAAVLVALLVGVGIGLASGGRPAAAEPSPTLKWDDLVPEGGVLRNPLDELRIDQLRSFYAIQYWRSYQAGGGGDDAAPLAGAEQDAQQAERALTEQGIDVADLLRRHQAYEAEADRRGRAARAELDGREVSIAGYLLPLDFDAAGVKEFLLLPYVGACIHVPPPPPNQVVFVQSATPHQLSGLYESVLVGGRLQVAPVSKSLSLRDGSNYVDAGYALQATAIEPYR